MGRALELAIALDPAVILQRAGMPPDPWQASLLRDRPQQALLCCTRQGGKTAVSAGMAADTALTPDTLTLILSPSERQSKETLRRTKLITDSLNLPGMKLEEDSSLRIEYANGSRIIALPDKEGNIRGFSSVHFLLIDEAARVSDQLYHTLRPMLAVSKGRMVALSTPWGKRGWFHKAWTEEPDWRKVMVKATECPRITPAFLEQERRSLPDLWFRQEYFCEFVDLNAAYFPYDLVKAAFTDEVDPLFEPANTPLSAGVETLFQ